MAFQMYFFVEKCVNEKWISCDLWEQDFYYKNCFFVPDKYCFIKHKTTELASILTGYQNLIEPIKYSYDIPKDVCFPVKLLIDYEKNYGGGFTKYHNSYNINELVEFFENKKHTQKTKKFIDSYLKEFTKITLKKLKQIKNKKEVSDVRIIVWLEN